MPDSLTRILSDLHFGDRGSRIRQLGQLRPLLAGVDHLVLNGDTLDTRPGPSPAHTETCIAHVREFFGREVGQTHYLTGNHDADFSLDHHLDLAGGKVFAIHGDILFDDLVPWSSDAPLIAERIKEELARLPPALHDDLNQRCALIRRVAASIPQRHQSERQSLRYILQYLADTVWPPQRIFRILHAWRDAPVRAAALARRHRPQAGFLIAGHTHRPGIWRDQSGFVTINTGSYCPPLGGFAVDVTMAEVKVRPVRLKKGEFRTGEPLATFPLTTAAGGMVTPS